MAYASHPPDLCGTGKTKHVFVCFSQRDSKFAREEIIEPLKQRGFITCDFEEDFIPGVSIFDNITTAIKESRKYILVISKHFKDSRWCDYESQLTLSLSIDMKASNVVIPLSLDGSAVPDHLSIFQKVVYDDRNGQWLEKICKSLGTPIKELPLEMETPPLPNSKEYHFISIAHLDVDDKLQKLDIVKEKTSLKFQELQVKKGLNPDKCILRIDGKENPLTLKELIEKVEKYVAKSSKIIFWLSNHLESDSTCKSLLSMLCLMAEDKSIRTAPWIIPICLENNFKFPDNLRQTCLFTRNGKWLERMRQAICRTDIGYRCKKQELKFRENVELFRIAEFEGRMIDEKSPRFLGITFIDEEHIILLDADNYTIKKCTLLGEIMSHIKLPKRPNRLSRVDNSHVAIIYENDVEIIILNTKTMSLRENIIKPPLKDGEVIKGITALSLTEFFIATNGGMGRARILKLEINGGKPTIENSVERFGNRDVFEMPRRLTTTPDKSKIIVADENDRRLILLDRNCKLVHAQDKWNRGLYNLRGVTASSDTIYIAACNEITTANLNNAGTGKNTAGVRSLDIHPEPLIKFPPNVYHTRAVALDQSGKYIAVSQAIDKKEIVRVFVMQNPADMSCKWTTPTKFQRHFWYSALFHVWEIFNYLE